MKTHLAGSATYLAHLFRIEERPRELVIHWAAASIANVAARGGYLKKNAGTDGSEDAAARSITGFDGDGYVKYATRLNGTVYFGLATLNNTAASSSIGFAIRVESNGTVKVYEAGVLKYTHGSAARAGDWLKVQRVGTAISYWLNRTLMYTSASTSSATLYCDTCLLTRSATVERAVFGHVQTVINVTDHTRPLTFEGESYSPLPMIPTAFVRSDGLKPNNAELTHILTSAGVSEADLVGGRWDYARYDFSAVNYLDLTLGVAQRAKGVFGEFKVNAAGYFSAELRGLSQPMSQELGRIMGALCDARQLGNFECGQPLDSYMHDSTVSSASGLMITVGLSPAKANGYFEFGMIFFRSGSNKWYEREIKNNIGNVLTLQRPFPFTPAAADAVTVLAGCNRTFAKCKTFTNANNPSGTNAENFQGFHLMPGLGKLLRYPE
jgi:uncharacterized phage protein (TIGR02218 family)